MDWLKKILIAGGELNKRMYEERQEKERQYRQELEELEREELERLEKERQELEIQELERQELERQEFERQQLENEENERKRKQELINKRKKRLKNERLEKERQERIKLERQEKEIIKKIELKNPDIINKEIKTDNVKRWGINTINNLLKNFYGEKKLEDIYKLNKITILEHIFEEEFYKLKLITDEINKQDISEKEKEGAKISIIRECLSKCEIRCYNKLTEYYAVSEKELYTELDWVKEKYDELAKKYNEKLLEDYDTPNVDIIITYEDGAVTLSHDQTIAFFAGSYEKKMKKYGENQLTENRYTKFSIPDDFKNKKIKGAVVKPSDRFKASHKIYKKSKN